MPSVLSKVPVSYKKSHCLSSVPEATVVLRLSTQDVLCPLGQFSFGQESMKLAGIIASLGFKHLIHDRRVRLHANSKHLDDNQQIAKAKVVWILKQDDRQHRRAYDPSLHKFCIVYVR